MQSLKDFALMVSEKRPMLIFFQMGKYVNHLPWMRATGKTMGRGYSHDLLIGVFEPSQPQRIVSGLKTYYNLSPSYSFHESVNSSLYFSDHNSLSNISQRNQHNTLHILQNTNLSWRIKIISTISICQPRKTMTHVLEPIYIPRALTTGTCITCL